MQLVTIAEKNVINELIASHAALTEQARVQALSLSKVETCLETQGRNMTDMTVKMTEHITWHKAYDDMRKPWADFWPRVCTAAAILFVVWVLALLFQHSDTILKLL